MRLFADQTLNSSWAPPLKDLFSVAMLDAWTPMVTVAMFLKMKLGYL